MKPATPRSPIRRRARMLIAQVIEDNVFGPVQCLPHEDVLELRRLLRAAYPFDPVDKYRYYVWCQEVRAALGFVVRMPRRKPRPAPLRPAHTIMPCMREWASKHGIIA